jgi:hypothetical protein
VSKTGSSSLLFKAGHIPAPEESLFSTNFYLAMFGKNEEQVRFLLENAGELAEF